MSHREWRLFLEDILVAITKIQRYIEGMNLESYVADDKTRDAVEREFIIIGEAARAIPPAVVAKFLDVPWQDMRDMRNFTVHAYWRVEPEEIWDSIHKDLPPLVPQLRAILAAEGE